MRQRRVQDIPSPQSLIFQKIDDQFQEFIQRTGGSLIQSEAHTRKDLMVDDNKSATLDHIITWNFSNDDSAEMPAPTSTVHWIGDRKSVV